MDENIPEKSTINGVKIKLFPKSIKNEEKDTKMNLVKSISRPSTSHQRPIYLKHKNPIKKAKKAKPQIISVLHFANNRNKHIPIILKKSKLRARTEKLFTDLLTSRSNYQQSMVPSNNNQLMIKEELRIDSNQVSNECKQVVPFQGFQGNIEEQAGDEINICTDEYFAIQGKIIPNTNNNANNNMLVPFGNKFNVDEKRKTNFQVSKFVKIKRLVSILKSKQANVEENDSFLSGSSSNELIINETETVEDEVEAEAESDDNNVVTVASEDIPYNAEIEIGENNDSVDSLNLEDAVEVDETPNELRAVVIDAKEALAFDALKGKSERTLFLEREDGEFCRAAQRKIKGIPEYGYRGFNAIHKFNYVLNLIPDESAATIHALMVTCKNQVGPVLDHLRYIQQCRKIMQTKRKYSHSLNTARNINNTQSTSSSFTIENTATPNPASTTSSSISTRKKKISYELDLSDNYADDSDEDYVPGKDLTPKKKKRNKRRNFSSKNKGFYECPVHKASPEAEVFNGNEGEASTSTSRNILSNLSHVSNNFPIENAVSMACENENSKKHHAGIFAQSEMLFKAEPVGKESLELVKFKKKRTPHSYIVPPVQKYMYAHEGVENNRFVALTKH